MKYLLLLLAVACSSLLIAQPWSLNHMDIDIQIHREGYIEVTESFDVTFMQERRGIYRYIPFKYKINGSSYELKIFDIDTEPDANMVRKEKSNYFIRLGKKDKYLTGSKKYQIKYKVQGPFLLSDTHEEFYWNLTGLDWEVPIDSVSYRVALSTYDKIDPNDIAVYIGPKGATTQSKSYTINNEVITGTHSKPLPHGSGLTIAVRLPSGYIDRMRMMEAAQREGQKKSPWWVLLPLGLLSAILGWWGGLRGKNPPLPIVDTAFPPEGMSPAEVGVFIDDIAHDRDVLSLLPYWAQMGVIRIERQISGDLNFVKIKNLPKERPDYEHLFFKAIFKRGDEVLLHDISKDMYATIYKVKSSIKASLVRESLYDHTYQKWFKGWRLVLPMLLLIGVGIVAFVNQNIVTGILSVVCALVIVSLSAFKPTSSHKGQLLKAKLRGLEKHLKESNPEDISALIRREPSYLGRMFPYAMALGLERSWTTKVEQVSEGVMGPSWFMYNGGVGTMSQLTSSLNINEVTSAFIQTPSSSGGSGSIGGGSSGGGFGGGGGGSW